jgi:hypothetical protein
MNNNRNNNSKYTVHYNVRNNNNGRLYNYNRKEIRPDFINVVNMTKLTASQRDAYLRELAYYIKCSLLRAGASANKVTNLAIKNVIRKVLKPTNIANLGNNVINKENIQPPRGVKRRFENTNSQLTTQNVRKGPYNSNTNSNNGGKSPAFISRLR